MTLKGMPGKPTHSETRGVLDQVRVLLDVHLVGPRCGFCGGARPYNIHKVCTLCHGRPVDAMNLVRAIREVVSPTHKTLSTETARRGEVRLPGQVETGTILTSGRRFTGNDD